MNLKVNVKVTDDSSNPLKRKEEIADILSSAIEKLVISENEAVWETGVRNHAKDKA